MTARRLLEMLLDQINKDATELIRADLSRDGYPLTPRASALKAVGVSIEKVLADLDADELLDGMDDPFVDVEPDGNGNRSIDMDKKLDANWEYSLEEMAAGLNQPRADSQ